MLSMSFPMDVGVRISEINQKLQLQDLRGMYEVAVLLANCHTHVYMVVSLIWVPNRIFVFNLLVLFIKAMPWSEGHRRYRAPPSGNTQTALVPLMVIAQCFGLLPVSGKLQGDYRLLKFSEWSFNSIYSTIVITFGCYLTILPFADVWYGHEMSFDIGRQMVFNIVSTTYMIGFYRLARKWKTIMKVWSDLEYRMARFQPVNCNRNMALFIAIYATTSFCEHVLSYSYSFEVVCFSWRKIFTRSAAPQKPGYDLWRAWSTSLQRPHQFINILLTASWNFTDAFISSISIALSSKFKQFNLELAHSSKTKGHSIEYWKTMRETYNQLALFTKFLDKHLSMFVVLSFFNNLFFVCFQLLNTLVYMSFWKKIYFVVSFTHILFRTCSVCLSAASIYESSRKPIKLLFMVPSETYNVEVHRLLLQVLLDRQMLTGFNFFYITKGLLFTVAGTILTYEIFLVQLDNLKDDDPDVIEEQVACP